MDKEPERLEVQYKDGRLTIVGLWPVRLVTGAAVLAAVIMAGAWWLA